MEVNKVVVLGDGGVGKTAITIQLCLNYFIGMYDPTIEDSYRKKMVIDHKPCTVEILDTAGQEEYTALADQWIRDGQGYLLVYSVNERSSFDRIFAFKDQILKIKGDDSIPVILVGNKVDLENEREISFEEGAQAAQNLKCGFIETSAKTGINIEKPFIEIVKLIRNRSQIQSPTLKKKRTFNDLKKSKKRSCIIL